MTENRIVTIDVSGADLKRALEAGLARLPNPSGGFPQVSGLTLEADARRPPGQRILSIQVGDAPLEDERIYRVATNDFLARGGDGYAPFRDAPPLLPAADSPLLAAEVIDYIKSQGTIRTSAQGRVVLR